MANLSIGRPSTTTAYPAPVLPPANDASPAGYYPGPSAVVQHSTPMLASPPAYNPAAHPGGGSGSVLPAGWMEQVLVLATWVFYSRMTVVVSFFFPIELMF